MQFEDWAQSNLLVEPVKLNFDTMVLDNYLRNSGTIRNIRESLEYSMDIAIPALFGVPRLIAQTDPPERIYAVFPNAPTGSNYDPKRIYTHIERPPIGGTRDREMTPGNAIRTKSDYLYRMYGYYVREVFRDGKWQDTKRSGTEYDPKGRFAVLSTHLATGIKYCWIHGKSDAELLADGLRPNSPFCWFIVEGRRRLIKCQEKLMFDRIIVSYHIPKAIVSQVSVKGSTGTQRLRVQYNPDLTNAFLCQEIGLNLADMYTRTLNVYRAYRLMSWPGGDPTLGPDELKRELAVYNAKTSGMWVEEFDRLVESMLSRTEPHLVKSSMKALIPTRLVFKSTVAMTDEANLRYLLKYRGKSSRSQRIKNENEEKEFSKESVFRRIYYKFLHNLDERFANAGFKKIREIKLNFLADMVASFIEVISGAVLPDNRDAWSNKHIDTPAGEIEHLISVAVTLGVENMGISKHATEKPPRTITQVVENNLKSSFKGSTWGVKGKYKKKIPVVFDLLHDTIPLEYADVVQIRPPLSTNKKQIGNSIRAVQQDQIGFIDPEYTPEDEQAGLIKMPSLTCEYTFDQENELELFNFIKKAIEQAAHIAGSGPAVEIPTYQRHILLRPRNVKRIPVKGGDNRTTTRSIIVASELTKVYLNNRLVDKTKDIDTVYGILRDARARGDREFGKQPNHVNFQYHATRRAFFVFSNGGRLIRPLLVVDRVLREEKRDVAVAGTKGVSARWDSRIKLLEDSKNNPDLLKLSMLELVRKGYVEYLDCGEQSTMAYICQSSSWIDILRDMRNASESKYLAAIDRKTVDSKAIAKLKEIRDRDEVNLLELTHCEMDPQAILGFSSAANPLVGYAPAPRTTFQTKVGTHVLGCLPDFEHLFEPTSKILYYPQRPYFVTHINDIMQLDRYPAGHVVWVAFMALDANQEDGIVGNDAAFQRGMFRYIKQSTIKVEIPDGQETRPPSTAIKGSHNLDSRGIIREGVWVEPGDILVNKVKRVIDPHRESILIDIPERMESYEQGYVTRVEETGTLKSIINISVAELRKYDQSSKLLARFSQKGMVAAAKREDELPTFQMPDGTTMKPTLVINPHSIPSRMTIGMLYEGIITMAAICEGKRYDASSFRSVNIDAAIEIIRKNKFPSDMKFSAINPNTGELYENKIFFVPIYYTAPPHHYADEVQWRGPGGRKKTDTRDPLGHRGAIGGSAQRFGEQERDAALSHGATQFLRDRLVYARSAETVIVCSNPKCCAIIDERPIDPKGGRENVTCTACNRSAPVKVHDVPFVMTTFRQYLAALNIDVGYQVSPIQTGLAQFDVTQNINPMSRQS